MQEQTPYFAGPSSNSPTPDYKITKIPRRRHRVPISCKPCRTRKLKCSKQSPCDNCAKRGDEHNCTYETAVTTKRRSTNGFGGAGGSHDELSARLQRLEGMLASFHSQVGGPVAGKRVLSAVAAPSQENGYRAVDLGLHQSTDAAMSGTQQEDMESETDGVTSSLGLMKVDQERNKVHYIGDGHWASLLAEIANELAEAKSYWTMHKKEMEMQYERIQQERRETGSDAGCGPALLFGAGSVPPVKEILRPLPNKRTSKILLDRYFESLDPAMHILHTPSFWRQFDAFWHDQSKASVVWVGMLFAMMRVALLSYVRDDDEPAEYKGKCQDMANTFRTQMAYCLITADYTKAHAFIIETLIFHLHAEYSSNRDSETSVWVLMGMIVRLAMKMGYHRDSKNFKALSPFQGEMRRRVWTFIRTGDLLFSFQNALPPMIRLGESDTELPRNLRDEDFDENSLLLPSARSANDRTPISYMIGKGKLTLGFGRVMEEMNSADRKSYDNVVRIDQALRDIYREFPDHLKVSSVEEQRQDPTPIVTARYGLATVYHTALCVLHRRYVRLAKPGNRYMYSRLTCLESAMQLLSFQTIQNSHEWRTRVSSLISHDYLMACTLVCMDLQADHKQREAHNSTPGGSSAQTPGSSKSDGSNTAASIGGEDNSYIPGLPYTREDLVNALERSRDIWRSQENVSMEAYKASRFLTQLLKKLHKPPTTSPRGHSHDDNSSPSISTTANANPERDAAMVLGILQQGTPLLHSGASVQAAQAAQLAQQAQMQISSTEHSSIPWTMNDGSSSSSNMVQQFTSPSNLPMIGTINNPISNLFSINDNSMANNSNLFDARNSIWAQPVFPFDRSGLNDDDRDMNVNTSIGIGVGMNMNNSGGMDWVSNSNTIPCIL